MTADEKKEAVRDFIKTVNMPPSTLRKWLAPLKASSDGAIFRLIM